MKKRLFVPEVLQTSAMDCGPAALKALLSGLGVNVHYARLREACMTGADGTSIDSLEELATSLGLEAFQEIAPVDEMKEILRRRAPCLAILQAASGAAHFVVVWAVHGPYVQTMDPGKGRAFVRLDDFVKDLFVHDQAFAPSSFERWWKETAWFELTRRRLSRLGVADSLADAEPRDMGALEAGGRLVSRLVERKALSTTHAKAVLERMVQAHRAREEQSLLTDEVLAIRFAPGDTDLEPEVHVRGAVFLSIHSKGEPEPTTPTARELLGGELPSAYPLLLAQLSAAGRILLATLACLVALTTVLAVAEMFVLRAAFNAQSVLALPQQRAGGASLYAAIVLVSLAVEASVGFGVLRLGRTLELRVRLSLLEKLPRLPDHYFRSRPMSDVTHRSQGLFQLRCLPEVLFNITKQGLDLLVIVLALCFVYPRGTPLALLTVVICVVLPYLGVRLRERIEARIQTHSSSLGQLYLDALLGLVPLRMHGGQAALRAKQDEHLVGWRTESERAIRFLWITEAGQGVCTLLVITLLLLGFTSHAENQSRLLLFAFWALRIPLEARGFSTSLQRLPEIRASLGRLLEPLTAKESQEVTEAIADDVRADPKGLALRLDHVTVALGGQLVLDDVSFDIKSGEHVAIVGNSGAGKTALMSTLLGLVECTEGRIFVDERPLVDEDLARLRRETVWVDPTVQVWNRSIIENLCFGNPPEAREALHPVIEQVALKDLLSRLPEGMATELGESGSRVSGGEGQRVRIARALLRGGARLVLLDEAFRGLERPVRRQFSSALRARIRETTVFEVTHDVADTLAFDRILVIEGGRLIEQGAPMDLLSRPSSRYASLLLSDREVQDHVWSASHWKRFVVDRRAGVTTTVTSP